MRAVWRWLWGLPLAAPLRFLLLLVGLLGVLAVLVVVFEWAGNLLDSGGAVGH